MVQDGRNRIVVEKVTTQISDDKYIWQGESSYVELNPDLLPAHIFRLHRRLRREVDFDYYI